jgi:hypothetical protein
MRFGTLHMILLISICLNFQLSYSQDVTQVSDTKRGTFMGHDCDDTEYRNSNGRPNWKNYGRWLSECDSLSDTYYDSVFAIQRAEKDKQKAIQDSIDRAEVDAMDFDVEFNMEAMWEQAVWEEIVEIQEDVTYETEYITAVAGVRGAEAEDEALAHLYYRKSMKGISIEDYKKAYGKLKNKRDDLFKKNPKHPKLEKMDTLLSQIKNKLKKV